MKRRFSQCIGVLVLSAAANAGVIYVDDDAGFGNDGSSWENAFHYIWDALHVAQAGDEIRIAQGSYFTERDEAGLVSPGDREQALEPPPGTTLRGGYAGLGHADPEVRDPEAYPTIITGDLASNDEAGFVNYFENVYHLIFINPPPAAETVYLDGLILEHANPADGGGGYGALHVVGGVVDVRDCVFRENRADGSGASGHFRDAVATISGCLCFENSSSHGWGGAAGFFFAGEGFAAVTNCRFEHDPAGNGWGRGIGTEECAFDLHECEFRHLADYYGGALYAGGNSDNDNSITNCTFDANCAESGGGAIWFEDCGQDVVMESCSFTNNTADHEGGGAVGGYVDGNVTIDGCTFHGNQSQQGAAILLGIADDQSPVSAFTLEMRDCEVFQNVGNPYESAIVVPGNDRRAILRRCDVHDNGCGGFSSHIWSGGRLRLHLDRTTIRDNAGHGLASNGGRNSMTMHDSAIIGNQLGGVLLDDYYEVDIVRCVIADNTIEGHEGAAGIQLGRSGGTIADCIIENNVARDGYGSFGGGGISVEEILYDPPLYIRGSTIRNNRSDRVGGGICLLDTADRPVYIDDCVIEGNTAERGGGIFATNSTTVVSGSTIRANLGWDGGGAIHSEDYPISILNCSLIGNVASHGSAIAGQGELTLANSALLANAADIDADDGGAIAWWNPGGVVTNTIVWGNISGSFDGYSGDTIAEYSLIAGGWPGVGNLDEDPRLVVFVSGTWSADASVDPETYEIVFTDDSASWEPESLVNRLLRPDDGQDLYWLIKSNTATTITVWPDYLTYFTHEPPEVYADMSYAVYEVRLAGDSPCLDAGTNSGLAADAADLDGDFNVEEPLPFDAAGRPRRMDVAEVADSGEGTAPIVDMGPMEYGAAPAGRTVYVDGSLGDDGWDGLCATWDGETCGPKRTIQAGIDAATDGDTVIVAAGTYRGEGNKELRYFGKAITVRSATGPAECVIDCEEEGRGFTLMDHEDYRSVIDGFTITNGMSMSGPELGGGAIGCLESSPVIRNCVLTGNRCMPGQSAWGGAIDCTYSEAYVVNCVIVGNTVEGGWGFGGGVGFYFGAPTLVGCVVAGNSCSGGNTAWGGGIHLWESNASIINCTIIGNVCEESDGESYGAGICAQDSHLLLHNTIVRGNVAEHGAQLAVTPLPWYGLARVPGKAVPDLALGGCSITPDYCNIAGGLEGAHVAAGCTIAWLDHNMDVDPGFVDALGADGVLGTLDDDYRLRSDSSCIDAGDNTRLPMDWADLDGDGVLLDMLPFDLDLNPRRHDVVEAPDTGFGEVPLVDLGAYERFDDCNENGLPDAWEIAEGLASDCNENLVPDWCDVAAGTSGDCNSDGIPDECQLDGNDCDENLVPDGCQSDGDGDGVIDACDGCPDDAEKVEPGLCGCGTADTDGDGDGTPDCLDGCPKDSEKVEAGQCGCGTADSDSDGDGVLDCLDNCPDDPGKAEPGACGCGVTDDDTDGDGVPDCDDGCPEDAEKTSPGLCGCSEADLDSDGDGFPDCVDGCPGDPAKIAPGECGCGVAESACADESLPPVIPPTGGADGGVGSGNGDNDGVAGPVTEPDDSAQDEPEVVDVPATGVVAPAGPCGVSSSLLLALSVAGLLCTYSRRVRR